MKKLLIIGFSLIGLASAHGIHTVITNTQGEVTAGTWLDMKLQSRLNAKVGAYSYTATTREPIYNQLFSELLIPVNAKVFGTYHNYGDSCYFSVEKISFNNTDILLKPGAYSEVNAPGLNQPACNPKLDYMPNQIMELQTKVVIPNLSVISQIKRRQLVENSTDDFIQTIGNSAYAISNIKRFDDGLVQVLVKFNDKSIKDKLVPVYYDDYGIGHGVNYTVIPDALNSSNYLMPGHYTNFGFGIME